MYIAWVSDKCSFDLWRKWQLTDSQGDPSSQFSPWKGKKWRSLNECSYTKMSAIQAKFEWERVLRQMYHPVWRMEFTLLAGSKKRSPNVNYKEVRTSSKYTKRLIGLDWKQNQKLCSLKLFDVKRVDVFKKKKLEKIAVPVIRCSAVSWFSNALYFQNVFFPNTCYLCFLNRIRNLKDKLTQNVPEDWLASLCLC